MIPVRVRTHDPDLGVDVSRVVGYRAPCPVCGFWERWPTVRAARSERDKHVAAAHDGDGDVDNGTRYLCHDCGTTLDFLEGSTMLYCPRCERRRRLPIDPHLVIHH